MSNVQHSKDPWTLDTRYSGCATVFGADGFEVAKLDGTAMGLAYLNADDETRGHWSDKPDEYYTERSEAEILANGNLMMAAPTMAKALEEILKACTEDDSTAIDACVKITSIAEKALRLVDGYPPPDAGVCRVCGCTEIHACIDTETGTPCAWADDTMTLCTVCDKAMKAEELHDEVNYFYWASIALGNFVGMPWAEWLACSIGRICTAGGGPYVYDALCFVEKGIDAGSAEALYMDAIGSPQEYLLGRLESAATLRGVRLPERPDDVKSEALIDPAPEEGKRAS